MDIRRAGGICGSFAVCIDSYHNGVPVGRFYSDGSDTPCVFESATQCLSQMEQIMDGNRAKDGQPPRFECSRAGGTVNGHEERRGSEGTFLLRILFRQNGSWQGSVTWVEGKQEQPFRSVLELILLVDSALQGHKCF